MSSTSTRSAFYEQAAAWMPLNPERCAWLTRASNDDERALLLAIYQNPRDDTPRLVYCDWLEESGDPDRCERAYFIREQCGAAELEPKIIDRMNRFAGMAGRVDTTAIADELAELRRQHAELVASAERRFKQLGPWKVSGTEGYDWIRRDSVAKFSARPAFGTFDRGFAARFSFHAEALHRLADLPAFVSPDPFHLRIRGSWDEVTHGLTWTHRLPDRIDPNKPFIGPCTLFWVEMLDLQMNSRITAPFDEEREGEQWVPLDAMNTPKLRRVTMAPLDRPLMDHLRRQFSHDRRGLVFELGQMVRSETVGGGKAVQLLREYGGAYGGLNDPRPPALPDLRKSVK